MKKFAFVLSFIVFVLSIAPCCALADHVTQSDSKAVLKQQKSSQDEDCCQDCSPFYTCGTCGGFMATPLISFTAPQPTLLPIFFNLRYLQSFVDGIAQNIWQPPKLS
ncbi:DUF6660 family protein [Pedobacter sp. Du54]|uniref:DUF6660 family protein n=1 Tax=Pedobacter anseongensis TaxID=3133439 RepID=UPI0030962FA0